MSNTWGDCIPCKPRRAHRFAIRIGVRYRAAGHLEWLEGRIENISESGVLFEGERILAVNTPVEFKFLLPPTTPEELAAEVVCRGEIVRTLEEGNTAAVAATIDSYRFHRQCLSANA